MAEFFIKKGLADVELKNWIKEHKDEPFVRVNIEVESSHERLRRSFHCLLEAVHKSGEHNIEVDGERIVTVEDLKNYYKLQGCDGKAEWYRFKKFRTKDKEWLVNAIQSKYGEQYLSFIIEDARSWKVMNKKQKTKALDRLFTDIKYSMTNNQKVLEWVAKIKGDIEMLNDINYHKNLTVQ